MHYLKMIIISCMFVLSFQTKAGLITSDISGLGGDEYEISYTITNDSDTIELDWFTLYFDYDLFSSIEFLSSSNSIWDDWDPIIYAPSEEDEWDGVLDAFADPIAIGGVLSGLIIKVVYSGSDISPWEQYATFPFFDEDEFGDFINEDAFAFVSIASYTPDQELDNSTPVPEPGTLGIFLIALAK